MFETNEEIGISHLRISNTKFDCSKLTLMYLFYVK